MSTSKRGRKNILKPCPKCGKMRGRTFDLPRVDDGSGGRTIVMPGGGMIPEARLCSCPKGERPYFRRHGYGQPFRLPPSMEYDFEEMYGGITFACRRCWWQECGQCFNEDLAIITLEGRERRGESIPGNSRLIGRCRDGRFWQDKYSTMMRGLSRAFGFQGPPIDEPPVEE